MWTTRVWRQTAPTIIRAEKLDKLSNRDFSVFISSTASIESIRAVGLDGLVHALTSRSPLLTHKDASRIVTGLSRLDVAANQDLIEILGRIATDSARIKQFQAHEIASMCVELSACFRRTGSGSHFRPVLTRVVDLLSAEFSRKIFAASPVDLACMASAVADAGMIDSGLMERVALAATIQIAQFRGPELADLVLAFATLGFRSSVLLEAAFKQLSTRIHALYTPQLLQLGFVIKRFRLGENDLNQFITKWTAEIESRDLSEIPMKHLSDFAVSISETHFDLPRTRVFLQNCFRKNGWDPILPGLASALLDLDLVIGRDVPLPSLKGNESVTVLCDWLHAVSRSSGQVSVVSTEFIQCINDLVSQLVSQTLQKAQAESVSATLLFFPMSIVKERMADIKVFVNKNHSPVITGAQEVLDFVSTGLVVGQNLSQREDEVLPQHLHSLIDSLKAAVPDVTIAAQFSSGVTVRVGTQNLSFRFLSSRDYHSFADGSRDLKIPVAMELARLEVGGFRPIMVNSKDWRVRDTSARQKFVRDLVFHHSIS